MVRMLRNGRGGDGDLRLRPAPASFAVRAAPSHDVLASEAAVTGRA
ncbi:hypothetical protein ACFH04_12270 [Streptomyces noboritoensis]|uniref:Uncharacterized protein n=1 Tax=Streptomyces noboritoensis TaxID=67337 RepID=A0ABV6TFA9_9ACTN